MGHFGAPARLSLLLLRRDDSCKPKPMDVSRQWTPRFAAETRGKARRRDAKNVSECGKGILTPSSLACTCLALQLRDGSNLLDLRPARTLVASVLRYGVRLSR